MTIDDAQAHFEEMARKFYALSEPSEAEFWKLQVAARDALITVDTSSGVLFPALFDILSITQTLLGGTAASLVKKGMEGWSVSAATGENAASLTGAGIDPEGGSISAQVIKSERPFYFAAIGDDEKLAAANDPNRYMTDYFCSFPVPNTRGEVIAILNVAGMSGAHPLFATEPGAIISFITVVGAKLMSLDLT